MSSEGKKIFVGGAPRSGTTLLRNILDSHPDICSGPEFDLVPSIVEFWCSVTKKVESGRIAAYLNNEQVDNAFSQLIWSLLNPYRLKRGKIHIAEKTPGNVLVFPILHRLLPDAYMIHIVRDARDVVASMLEVASKKRLSGENPPRFAQNIENAAQTWTKYVTAPRKVKELFTESTFQDKYIEISYEDLINHPEDTLRYLCKRLEIAFSKNMLSPDLYPHEFVAFDAWGSEKKMNAPIHNSSIGRWRRDLTIIERAVVAHYCREELKRLGYVNDSYWIWNNCKLTFNLGLRNDICTILRLSRNWLLGRTRSLISFIKVKHMRSG